MIDTHCHILPELDDGPTTWDESIAMAQRAAQDGISHIIATPHYKKGIYENTGNSILQQVDLLNQLLIKNDISLTVLPGCEISLYEDMLKDILDRKVLTLNHSPYVLIELPGEIRISHQLEDTFFNLQLKGFIPIIAHIERCIDFYHHFDRLIKWVDRGIDRVDVVARIPIRLVRAHARAVH